MSVVHDSLRRDGNLGRSWFLKIADGSSYGPVGLSTLCEWSAQSRIVPGNKVSHDGRRWVPAETVRELKMEWVAELPNGDKYGPFNVLAVPHLFQSGTLPPEAKLTNRVSGKTVLVYELVKATLAEQKPAAEATVETAPAIPMPARSTDIGPKEVQIEFQILEPPDIKAEPVAMKDDRTVIQDLESQVKYLSIQLEHTRREWARDKDSLAATSGAREEELAGQVERLKKKTDTFESEIEGAKTEAASEHRRSQELQELLRRKEDELRTKAAQFTAQLESRSVEVERATENAEKKNVDLGLRINELENMLKEAGDKAGMFGKDLAGQKEHYEYVIAQEREQQEELKRRIEETERELDSKTTLLGQAMRTAEEEKSRLSDTRTADAQNKELRLQIASLEDRFDRAERQLREKDDRYTRAEQQNTVTCGELKQNVSNLQAKAASTASDLENARKELESHRTQAAEAAKKTDEERQALRREIDEARNALADAGKFKTQASAGEDNYRRLKMEHEAVVQHLEAAKSELQHALSDQEFAQKQHVEFQVAMQSASVNTQKLAEAQQESERLRKHLNDKEQDWEAARKELAVAKEKCRNLEEQNRLSSQQIETTKADLQRANEELELSVKQQRELQSASKSASEAERKLTEAQKQCESLTKQIHVREQEALKQLQKVQAKADNAAREIEGLQQNLKTNAAAATQETEKLRREIAARDDKYRALEQQSKATAQELGNTKTDLQRLREEHERVLKQRNDTESAARQAAATAEQKLAEAMKQSDALARELRGRDEKFAKDNEQLLTRADKLARETEKLRKEITSKEETLGAQDKQSAALAKELDNARSELKLASKQTEALIVQHQKEKSATTKRLSELEAEKIRYMEAAVKAGARLTEPAKIKPFRPLMKTAAVIAALLGYSYLLIFSWTRYTEFMGTPETEEEVQVVKQVKPEAAKPEPKPIHVKPAPAPVTMEPLSLSTKKEPPAPAQPQKTAWPEIKADNVKVVRSEKSCAIIFDFGIFRSLTKFSDDAVPTLEQVATQLRGSISNFDLVIEGHADMVPISNQAASSFADNDKLGMERAKAVRDLFRDKFNIPADHMKVVSCGEKDPPFSNDDETSRKKNRTVVLKLTARNGQK